MQPNRYAPTVASHKAHRRDEQGRVVLSPSNAYRAWLCSGSVLTPFVPERTPGYITQRGTDVHAALEKLPADRLERLGILPPMARVVAKEVNVSGLLRGTIDLIYEDKGQTVAVDYKTGNLDHPEYHVQMSYYAHAANVDRALLMKISYKTLRCLEILEIPKPPEGWINTTLHHRLVSERDILYHAGEHCQWCSVKEAGLCPEHLRSTGSSAAMPTG